MKIHTVQLHIGDFRGGTEHMDATELGAYFSLILCAYQFGDHRLPIEDARLCRMAKCSPKTWRRIKEVVLAKFTLCDSFWEHETVNRNLESYSQKSQKNRANALKRYEASMPIAERTHSETPAIQYPISSIQNKKKEKTLGYSPDFEEFWRCYPNPINKSQSSKSYQRALKEVDHATLINRVNEYAAFCQRSGSEKRFICHPTTWLNQRRWENDYSRMDAGAAGAQSHNQPQRRGLAALEAAGDKIIQQAGGLMD